MFEPMQIMHIIITIFTIIKFATVLGHYLMQNLGSEDDNRMKTTKTLFCWLWFYTVTVMKPIILFIIYRFIRGQRAPQASNRFHS